MGRYDNYDNKAEIKRLRKKLEKLQGKRKPDLYEIDMVKRELDNASLFETCQIFGTGNPWAASANNPNTAIMFSDDNRVMKFCDKIIRYDDISHVCLLDRKTTTAHTITKRKGVASRSIVGGLLGGGVGAIIGGATAGSVSDTVFNERNNGYILQIFQKDGQGWQYEIEGNKLSKQWRNLLSKLQMIIDSQSIEG